MIEVLQMARMIDLPTALNKSVQVCGREIGMSGNQFIQFACEAAVKALTESDPRIRAILLLSIDQQSEIPRIPA
jgi:hypothetical protein